MLDRKFDEFFNVREGMGRNFVDLPMQFRVKLFQEMEKDQLEQFKRGHANDELIMKVQSLWNEFFDDLNHTTDDILKRNMEAREKDRIDNLTRELNWKKAQLEKMDQVAKMDGKLPYGQRERLRTEIAGIEKELTSAKKVSSEPTEKETDWVDEILKIKSME